MTRALTRWVTRILIGLASLAAVAVLATPASGQPFSAQVQIAVNNMINGITSFSFLGMNASAYINWGTGRGTSGYGIRDNAGTIQSKN